METQNALSILAAIGTAAVDEHQPQGIAFSAPVLMFFHAVDYEESSSFQPELFIPVIQYSFPLDHVAEKGAVQVLPVD